MEPKQCRMARAALDWSTAKLAEVAGVGVNTVNRFERGGDARISSANSMQTALEAAGVEFTNGGQPGVRIAFIPATCAICGLRAKVRPTETEIDNTAYVSNCKLAADRPAFDFGCPNLLAAVSLAHQVIRRV